MEFKVEKVLHDFLYTLWMNDIVVSEIVVNDLSKFEKKKDFIYETDWAESVTIKGK